MRPIRTMIFLLVCLGLIILAVMLLRSIFTTGSKSSTDVATTKLVSYAHSGSAAEFVTDGPIVHDQAHRTMRIIVDEQTSRIELIDGYNNSVVRQESFPNTAESYKAFLAGLETAGFSRGIKNSESTELGKCPLQNRYVYKMSDNSNTVFRYWASSCSKGTFGGQTSSVHTLFRRQIPSTVYNDISRQFDVNF